MIEDVYLFGSRRQPSSLEVQRNTAENSLMGCDLKRRLICVGEVNDLDMADVTSWKSEQRVV